MLATAGLLTRSWPTPSPAAATDAASSQPGTFLKSSSGGSSPTGTAVLAPLRTSEAGSTASGSGSPASIAVDGGSGSGGGSGFAGEEGGAV